MKPGFRLYFSVALGSLILPSAGFGAVVFSKGEKAKYVEPGEEQISGTAQQIFTKAQEAEQHGDLKRAIKLYGYILHHHPKDGLAAGATFKMAELQEKRGDTLGAAVSYKVVLLKYPRFERFEDAVENEFRIGELYLNGKKTRLFGIALRTPLDDAISIFAAIVQAAPYGRYAARAQFDIGLAREKQGASDLAVVAYQAVIDKFPNDPVAADAQYQIGYIWMRATKQGTYDAAASKNAKTGFEDFLYRHPNSEKSAQARQNLQSLEHKQTADSFQIAKYYDKQKNYRAAVIYYNDVVRQQPGSKESDHAQQRIAQLRKKVGDAALQPPALTAATAKKPGSPHTASARNSTSDAQGSSTDNAPLPPPENDASLPPPASLSADPTNAPFSDPSSLPSSSSAASPAPSPSPQP